MANTTNYNWETPDDTDLVKDGAAAIRTLGNSIDTTTKALNPETTLGDIAYRSSTSNTKTRLPIGSNGQILGVSAGVPAWINNDQGDITEVQAGVGISIASGTGPIPVITNSSTDLITTAGDLLYGTAADTVARLGIGTAGQVLKVNSGATAPEWGAAAAGYVGVGLSMTAQSQNITNQTYTALTFGAGSEEWDTDGFHDTSTNNSRITIPTGKGGKYAINGLVFFNSAVTTGITLLIYKNGSVLPGSTRGYLSYVQAANSEFAAGNTTINLAANDYIELFVYANSNQNEVVYDKVFIATYLGA